MKQYCLFDDSYRDELLPLTFTKPVSELRIGILTIREKWKKYLGTDICSWKTQYYLSGKFPFQEQDNTLFINGHVCPTQPLAEQIKKLELNQGIFCGDRVIAVCVSNPESDIEISSFPNVEWISWDENSLYFPNHGICLPAMRNKYKLILN